MNTMNTLARTERPERWVKNVQFDESPAFGIRARFPGEDWSPGCSYADLADWFDARGHNEYVTFWFWRRLVEYVGMRSLDEIPDELLD